MVVERKASIGSAMATTVVRGTVWPASTACWPAQPQPTIPSLSGALLIFQSFLSDRFTSTGARPLKGQTHKIDLKVGEFPLAGKIKPDVDHTIIKESSFTVKKRISSTQAG
jgi:hypothetical protein